VSARSSVIRLNVVILLCWNFALLLRNFCWWECNQGIHPRYATDTHTTGFWKLCNYVELSKPSFVLSAFYQKTMKESRKILFPKKTSELAGFFLTLHMLSAKEGICEYPLVLEYTLYSISL